MHSYNFVVLFTVCLFNPSEQGPVEPFFRSDYQYVTRQEAFYKVHSLPRDWKAAYTQCTLEGSSLLYPDTQDEATLIIKLMNENLPKDVKTLWLGAHDMFAEGIYVNVKGEDLSSMFSTWNSGEPNDLNHNEDCVDMTREGTLNDDNCEYRFPFICKKNLSALRSNPLCETADPAYVPNADKSRCYKVHPRPKTWHDAFATCHAEQSYLTIINSPEEAKFILGLIKNVSEDKIKVPYNKAFISVGFHDLYHEGEYLTIHGETLQQAGYNQWAGGQPDNYVNNENCGTITRQGLLNDITCDVRMIFVCERNIGDPNVVDLYSRFQVPETVSQ